MNDKINKPTAENVGLFPFYMLQNFPYIEETFDAVTYYEMLCKVVEYLNNVIKNLNSTEEDVRYIYKAFTQLQDYVNHYFDNLDVQNEINNKLDKMVVDGIFDTIINEKLFGPLNEKVNTNEKDISNLKEKTTDNKSEIDTINDNILDSLVLIGDSWTDKDRVENQETKWYDILATNLNLKLYNYAVSGVTVDQFIYQFEKAEKDPTLIKNKVKNVVIFGGVNDFRLDYTSSKVITDFVKAYNKAREIFPKAKITLITNCQYPYISKEVKFFEIIKYDIFNQIGVNIHNLYGVFQKGDFESNLFHIKPTSQKMLVSCVESSINDCDIFCLENTQTLTSSEGNTLKYKVLKEGQLVNMEFYFNFSSPITAGQTFTCSEALNFNNNDYFLDNRNAMFAITIKDNSIKILNNTKEPLSTFNFSCSRNLQTLYIN